MTASLKERVSNIAMVKDRMMYIKGYKERGIILGKIIDELGDWLQYIFLPRNPGYFYEESVFINFLIDESKFNDDNKLDDDCLTKRLINWINENIPHNTFEEITDIEVWGVDSKPQNVKGEFMDGNNYSLVINTEGIRPYMWVWKR